MARDNYIFERWELGADAIVAPDDLPIDLRYLAPLLKRWAFTSQSRRDDFVERLSRHQPEGLDEFCKQMNEAQGALRSWLAHVLASNARPHDTAITVGYALKTFELVKPGDFQKVAEFQIAMQAAKEFAVLKQDLDDANIAFSEHRYDSVVELLSRHENDLDDLTSRKLAFAIKKTAQQHD